MNDNVIRFPGVQEEDIQMEKNEDVSVDEMLDYAKEFGLESVIIIGKAKGGADPNVYFERSPASGLYFAATESDTSKILYDIECAKHILMNIVFSYD